VEEDKGNSNTNEPIAENKPPANTQPKIDPTNPVINKRPFVQLAILVSDLQDRNLVKLDSTFAVNAKGKLTEEGRFDPQTFEWLAMESSDPRMKEVIKEAVEALNDSGYLQYLAALTGKDLNLMVQQDDVNILAVAQSELENENRAKSIKSGLDIIIDAIKARKSAENADQNDKDDLLLLQNAKVETDGKKIQIRFMVPKNLVLPMIQRKLAEQKAQPKTPSGTGMTRPNVNTGK
jgi:hypothetical protein